MSAKIHRQQRLYRGRVFDFTIDTLTLENGETVDLEVIRHPGAAAIVAMPDPSSLLLLRQFRHAVGGYIREVPAGTFDGKETPETCARRELIEETGFAGRRLEKLGEITPVPGYSDERIHIFLATDLIPDRQQLDRDELIQVQTVSLEAALAMVDQGEIQDAKTIAALMMVQRRLFS
jgi:ADP-ribose pyrophosphatase